MKKLIVILLLLVGAGSLKAQKIDSIYFNLYTDSLKKGVYNYINVDGKTSTGTYLPLMSDEVELKSSAGKWVGNSLIIDSSFTGEKVTVTASLKKQPEIKKTVTIYMKKIEVEPDLKSEAEVIESYKKQMRRRKE